MSEVIVNNEYTRNQCIATLQALNTTKPWSVTIKRKVKRRSNNQNALMWKWIGEVATHVSEATGYESDEVHNFFKQKFLAPQFVKIGDEEVPYWTTTKLSTAEMSNYMDAIYRWATGELGLILPIPEMMHER